MLHVAVCEDDHALLVIIKDKEIFKRKQYHGDAGNV